MTLIIGQNCHTMNELPATRIQLCGPLVVRLASRDIARSLPGAQGRLAFAFLITNRDRGATRAELSAALWADTPPPEAGTALRALLSKLRRLLSYLGEDSLPTGELLKIRLPPDAWVDTEAAARAVHDAQAAVAQHQDVRAWVASHIALNISARPFMAGHDSDWVLEQRAALDEIQVHALEALAACAVRLGGPELDTAVRASRRLVATAPFRETAYAWLMRALAAQGNTAEALLTYEGLRVTLRRELGTNPSHELQSLHASLLKLAELDR
jgi:SARP family transcriptional regulator, regulator of embCAB operon